MKKFFKLQKIIRKLMILFCVFLLIKQCYTYIKFLKVDWTEIFVMVVIGVGLIRSSNII